MTQLLYAEFEDETGIRRRLTREELLAYVNIVAAAGNDTTRRLISWTGKVLAEHPDQLRMLVEDRTLAPNAIEEVLRFEPPPLQNCRYVARDCEWYGRTVPAGSALAMLVPSANRDERHIDDPDRFDVTRRPGQIFTFGFGAHYCLGQALARPGAVGGDVLVPVGNPGVRHRRGAELPSHLGSDLAAEDAVLDPVIADGLVGVAQGKTVGGFRMGEVGRIKVHPQVVGLGPVDPALEVPGLNLGAIDELATVVQVAGMQIEPVAAGNHAQRFLDIAAQLDGEAAVLKLADPGSPTLIHDRDSKGALFVLMPMRV